MQRKQMIKTALESLEYKLTSLGRMINMQQVASQEQASDLHKEIVKTLNEAQRLVELEK